MRRSRSTRTKCFGASAVVDNVLDETQKPPRRSQRKGPVAGTYPGLLDGGRPGTATLSNQALEHGLLLYEKRHPSASGLIQGSVVVLRNRDASILAETGGRQFYKDRSSCIQRLQPRDEVPAATRVRHETDCLSRGFSERQIRSGHHGARRAHQRCQWRGAGYEMDLELRWSIQGHDPPPHGAGGIQKRSRDLDRSSRSALPASWRRRGSGNPDAAAPLRHNGLGSVRSELAGTCQCIPHDCIGHR